MGQIIMDKSSVLGSSVGDINTASKSAVMIFEDITAGNESNLKSAQKQTEMTDEIIDLTDDVNRGMGRVIESIKGSYAVNDAIKLNNENRDNANKTKEKVDNLILLVEKLKEHV